MGKVLFYPIASCHDDCDRLGGRSKHVKSRLDEEMFPMQYTPASGGQVLLELRHRATAPGSTHRRGTHAG
jgi:hypothetical protein